MAKRKASAPAMGRRAMPTTNREVVSPQPRCLMGIPGSKRSSLLLASTHVRNGNSTIARKEDEEDVDGCSMMSVRQDVESRSNTRVHYSPFTVPYRSSKLDSKLNKFIDFVDFIRTVFRGVSQGSQAFRTSEQMLSPKVR